VGVYKTLFCNRIYPLIQYALQVVLSMKLKVAMALFYIRSVKFSDLAVLKDRVIQHSTKAARSLNLTDQVFTHLKLIIRDKSTIRDLYGANL
jgi:hypothetical protein